MKSNVKMKQILQMLWAVSGALLFAVGVNMIITPLGLYNGGFMGVAQLIRTFLVDFLHISALGQFDIAGVIYFLINLPLLKLAWTTMGKGFFIRTLITVVIQTAFLTLIPVPKVPIIDDMLTACIIGGIIAGFGTGMVLRGGSSGGGQDIIGIYCSKKYPGFSVGKISILMNIVVYGICAMLFNIEIVIYSLIYATVLALACDRVHIQNINMSVMIFTKKLGISRAIMEETGRGVTNWDGEGAYTRERSYILFVMISKYEVSQIKRIVQSIDKDAFMIFNEGASVSGNFEKRL
ncbi:MAG: YitT family protein [Lachnospiraceae bacterium]